MLAAMADDTVGSPASSGLLSASPSPTARRLLCLCLWLFFFFLDSLPDSLLESFLASLGDSFFLSEMCTVRSDFSAVFSGDFSGSF